MPSVRVTHQPAIGISRLGIGAQMACSRAPRARSVRSVAATRIDKPLRSMFWALRGYVGVVG